jgi:hypothetical protein
MVIWPRATELGSTRRTLHGYQADGQLPLQVISGDQDLLATGGSFDQLG